MLRSCLQMVERMSPTRKTLNFSFAAPESRSRLTKGQISGQNQDLMNYKYQSSTPARHTLFSVHWHRGTINSLPLNIFIEKKDDSFTSWCSYYTVIAQLKSSVSPTRTCLPGGKECAFMASEHWVQLVFKASTDLTGELRHWMCGEPLHWEGGMRGSRGPLKF